MIGARKSLFSFYRPKAAIQHSVIAVTRSDPYFPNPVSTDTEDEWIRRLLRSAYLLTAKDWSSDLAHKYKESLEEANSDE
jgi:hypothetical protein